MKEIAKGVNAIVVVPNDAKGLEPVFERAKATFPALKPFCRGSLGGRDSFNGGAFVQTAI